MTVSSFTPRTEVPLEAALPQATFQDATDLFDAVRSVKSVEEIEHLRQTSEILKQAYQAIEALLAPGTTERQVIAEGQKTLRTLGCLDGFAHVGRSSGPPLIRPPADDPSQPNDVAVFDLEFVGPSGYSLELSGHYSFGTPPDRARRIYDIQNEVYERCIAVMKPGASPQKILDVAQATYQKHGFGVAGPVQYHSHGIGLDFEESPLVPGHEVTLQEGMVLSLHPHIGPGDLSMPPIEIQDNILVTASGGQRLTHQQVEWTEI